jgi:hypothetical protein
MSSRAVIVLRSDWVEGDEKGRYERMKVTEEDYQKAVEQQQTWQMGRLADDEDALDKNKVPRRDWVYVSCNSDPAQGNEFAAQVGTWWADRASLEAVIHYDIAHGCVYSDPRQHAKYCAVVDGRDMNNIKRILAGSWDKEMTEGWIRYRAKVETQS